MSAAALLAGAGTSAATSAHKPTRHQGVGFTSTYANESAFVIPRNEWRAIAEQWVARYFSHPFSTLTDAARTMWGSHGRAHGFELRPAHGPRPVGRGSVRA